jgi:hypothetical protein
MKARLLALVLTLIFSASSAVAAPNPKAGASCAKQGLSKTYKAKQYTCIKSGKKLVWNKGVKVEPKQQAAPIPSSTPQPTPSASASASPTPSATPVKIPTTRREKALAEVKRVFESNSKLDIPVKYILSADAPSNFVSMMQEVIPVSARFWSDVYKPSGEFPIIVGTPGSVNWVNQELAKYGQGLGTWTMNMIRSQGRMASRGNVEMDENGAVTFYVIGEETEKSVPNNIRMMRGFVSHEYVHSVATSIFDHRQEGIPGWSVEGSANFYGYAITSLMMDDPESSLERVNRENLRRPYYESGGLVPHSLTPQQLHSALVLSEKGGGGDGTTCAEPKILCYSAGYLLTEILVADHGHKKFVDWWKGSKKKNWEEVFEDVYGIHIDQWYEEVAVPYILEESKKAVPEVSQASGSNTVRNLAKRAKRPFIEPGYKSSEAMATLKEYKNMREASEKTAKPSLVFGPNVDSGVKADWQRVSESALGSWSNYFKSSSPLLIHAGASQDIDWLFTQISALDSGFSESDKNQYREELNREQLLTQVKSFNNRQRIDFLAVPSRLTNYSNDYRKQEFAQMVIRAVQDNVAKGKSNVLPCWARVGQTKLLASLENRYSENTYFFDVRNNEVGNFYRLRSSNNFLEYDLARWLEFLPKIDGDGNTRCERNELSSSAGWVISEKQIAEFGLKKVTEWWGKSADNSNWRENFRTVFGKDVDTWYRQSAIPYLIEQFDKWQKPNGFGD